MFKLGQYLILHPYLLFTIWKSSFWIFIGNEDFHFLLSHGNGLYQSHKIYPLDDISKEAYKETSENNKVEIKFQWSIYSEIYLISLFPHSILYVVLNSIIYSVKGTTACTVPPLFVNHKLKW